MKLIKIIATSLIIMLTILNIAKASNVENHNGNSQKILILGAAGEIGRMLTNQLLEQTDADFVLYGRNVTQRLTVTHESREQLVDGDFKDREILLQAMQGVDTVYINDVGTDSQATQIIIKAMEDAGVKRVIAATVAGIYDEIPGAFGDWNRSMVSSSRTQNHIASAKAIEESSLDYTILRLTWLYNQEGNKAYMLTFKGEPFVGAQVTRQAVTQLIVDIINDPSDRFIRASVGVSEPNTDWPKPSFY